jgi:peptidoglycan hydrolase FlgJ
MMEGVRLTPRAIPFSAEKGLPLLPGATGRSHPFNPTVSQGSEGEASSPVSLDAAAIRKLRASFSRPDTPRQEKLKEAAQQFEAVFLNQLLEAMEKTIDREDSLLDGGEAEGTFRSMMYQEMATSMSKTGGDGLGLASSIYQQTVLLLGQEPPASPTTAS